MHDLKALLKAPPDELVETLAELCQDLAELQDRLGWLRSEIEKVVVSSFWTSEEASVAARDRESRRSVVVWQAEALHVEGKIDAHRTEARFVERLLDAAC